MPIGDTGGKGSPPKEPPAAYHEWWSAISPGDLGLKAGEWTGKDSDPMTFRPIVAWVTVMMRKLPFTDANPPDNRFLPVALSDTMFPVLAGLIPTHCGVFLKNMTEAEAKVRAREWMNKPGAKPLQPTMGMAQA